MPVNQKIRREKMPIKNKSKLPQEINQTLPKVREARD
jgi:hypothetical protein